MLKLQWVSKGTWLLLLSGWQLATRAFHANSCLPVFDPGQVVRMCYTHLCYGLLQDVECEGNWTHGVKRYTMMQALT